MPFEGFEFIRLTTDTDIKPFDCGNADLNGFLFDDAKPYLSELLATTFLLQTKEETVAFFSYLNDKVTHQETGNIDTFHKRIGSLLPFGKDGYKSYPAVKLGRLGVSNSFKGKRIGEQILDFTKASFLDQNKTGCKFITVDAYRESLKFYEKQKFNYLSSQDKKAETRLMYFNLKELQ